MGDVRRYFVQLFKLAGDEQRYAHGALGAVEIVRASDYDAAQSELAALREELAIIKDECIDHVNLHKAWTKERDGLQQSLTAAEQRNSEMLDILGTINCLGIVRLMDEGLQRRIKTIVHQLQREKIAAALKPTESGASE